MEKDATDLVPVLNELLASSKLRKTSRGPVWLIFPTVKDKIFAKFIYETTMIECKQNEILSIDKSLEHHKSLGLWDDQKESNLKKLPEFIEETKERIRTENNRIRKKKFEAWRRKLERDYYELIQSRNTILSNSAEFLSNDAATLYLLWACFKDSEYKSLWPSFKDLQGSQDIEYIEELLNVFNVETQDLSIKNIRELARLGMWRIRWNVSKNNIPDLFGRSTQDLSNDQFMLVYWSQVYDSVYESLDRPPDDVINNDETLDQWLTEQSEERARDIGKKFYAKSSNPKAKNSKIDNASEIFRVVDGFYNEKGEFVRYSEDERWAQVEKIRKLNSPTARAIKQREEEKLRKTPGVFVDEQVLRRSREEREAMGGTVKVITKKR